MKIQAHEAEGLRIAEIIADEVLIKNPEHALDILGDLYYQGFDKIVLHQKNLSPLFFDLKSGMAGEILQKFSNYRMKLAIVGDFASFTSKSLEDFIHECNQGTHVNFVSDLSDAL